MPGSMASQVMGWQRRMGTMASPFAATGESSNGNPVQIEMYLSGSWVDITSYVMVRDESGNIAVTRGRRDEGSTAEQQTLAMALNNRDARWAPRNPAGPYYGIIGRNTPVRVSVPDGLGGKSYRFQGEITAWPQSWDPTGTDIWTDVGGNGILQRLSQGPVPAYSLVRTALASTVASSLRAYWPVEDAADSKSIATPLVNGSVMTFTGTPTFADHTGFPSSDPTPTLASSVLAGGVTKYPDPTATQVRFFCYIPPDGLVNGTVVCSIDQVDYSAGSAQIFDVYYGNIGGTGRGMTLHTMASDGTDLGVDLENTFDVRGKSMYISIELQEAGTAITRALRIYDINAAITYDVTDTFNLTQLSQVTRVQFGPASRSVASPHGTTGLSAVSIGHVTVEDVITSNTSLGVYLNPIGETAGRRIQRVCGENALAFQSIGDLDDSVLMGEQTRLNALSQMQECELADDGMLYESMSALGVGYRTRASLQNQDPQLTLNYAGFNLNEIPTPVEDDRYIQNQVTVTVGTVSQTYALATGSLSVQQPPAGVGPYGQEITLNLQNTGDAMSQAAWRVHLGTVDEPRYPSISVNLAHSTFVNNPALKQAVLGLRVGDRVVVQNVPVWLPPGDVNQIILGFEETITHFEHRISLVCAPASPYRVGVLDDALAVIDTDGSALATAATSVDTTLVVAPSLGQTGLWTTDSTNFPVDVRVGGETVRVTAITDWLSDTFTRSVSSAWGTPDIGPAWSATGGSASDYSVNGSAALSTLSTVDVSRRTSITPVTVDFDVYCDITASAAATGDSLYGALTTRMLDSSTMYMARVEFTTSNTVTLLLRKLYADATTDFGSYDVPITYAAGTYVRVRFQGIGTSLRAKAWLATDVIEPPEWHVTATDGSISNAYGIGTRSIRITGNTNAASVAIQYDNFRIISPQNFTVTRSINGVVKAQVAGEDLRLATPTIISL